MKPGEDKIKYQESLKKPLRSFGHCAIYKVLSLIALVIKLE